MQRARLVRRILAWGEQAQRFAETCVAHAAAQVEPAHIDIVSGLLDDVNVTCGQDVAFATATGTCTTIGASGAREPLEFRLTMGLRNVDGKWRVMHEHHSVPATE